MIEIPTKSLLRNIDGDSIVNQEATSKGVSLAGITRLIGGKIHDLVMDTTRILGPSKNIEELFSSAELINLSEILPPELALQVVFKKESNKNLGSGDLRDYIIDILIVSLNEKLTAVEKRTATSPQFKSRIDNSINVTSIAGRIWEKRLSESEELKNIKEAIGYLSGMFQGRNQEDFVAPHGQSNK